MSIQSLTQFAVLHQGVTPGRKWRWARRLTQSIGLFALFVGPLLAGWQRLGQNAFAAWRDSGSVLPGWVSDHLPGVAVGEWLGQANPFLGGGIAAEHVSVPLMDPIAGALALLSSHGSWRAFAALGLPVLLGLVAGRFFCGWFCPFGVLARFTDRLLDLLPWRPRPQIPPRRPLRWMVLAGAIIASVLGVHWLLYLSLPYLLLQQASYAIWLLGGGAAVLAVLLGLLAAGLILGPTSYCATLCPTGGVLSLLGRTRPLRLAIAAPSACGARCDLCNEACWLHLNPASGDAGPDCDLCMRCVSICPRSNLRLSAFKTSLSELKLLPILIAGSMVALMIPAATVGAPMRKPRLLLEREQLLGDVTLAISVVDFSGITLDADAPERLSGAEVSIFVARGERGAADARGVLPRREVYTGPLALRLLPTGEKRAIPLTFDAPTSPISTVDRTIYRRRLKRAVQPGDRLILDPIPGWLTQPVSWVTPPRGSVAARGSAWPLFGAASFLIFLGVLSLAFAYSMEPSARHRSRRGPRLASDRF